MCSTVLTTFVGRRIVRGERKDPPTMKVKDSHGFMNCGPSLP
jgi:hypothetical protein